MDDTNKQPNELGFEQWYVENAFDYARDPIGSHECGLQRKAWHAALAAKASTPSAQPPRALPGEASDDWQHLKQYGYAPGNYLAKCYSCGKVAEFIDKRAICCRPCAEEKHAAALATPASLSGMSADGGLSACSVCGRPADEGSCGEDCEMSAEPAAAGEREPCHSSVQLAYGYLWHINEEPMAPVALLSPAQAANKARHYLLGLMTKEEQKTAIEAVRGLMGGKMRDENCGNCRTPGQCTAKGHCVLPGGIPILAVSPRDITLPDGTVRHNVGSDNLSDEDRQQMDRDAYEGAREDLLHWKHRALTAEAEQRERYRELNAAWKYLEDECSIPNDSPMTPAQAIEYALQITEDASFKRGKEAGLKEADYQLVGYVGSDGEIVASTHYSGELLKQGDEVYVLGAAKRSRLTELSDRALTYAHIASGGDEQLNQAIVDLRDGIRRRPHREPRHPAVWVSWIGPNRIIELSEQAFGPLYGAMNMFLVTKFAELVEREIRESAANYWNLPEQWLTEEDDTGLPEADGGGHA